MTYIFALPIVGLTVALVASLRQLRKQQSKYKLLHQKWEETNQSIEQSHAEHDAMLQFKTQQAQRIAYLEAQIEGFEAQSDQLKIQIERLKIEDAKKLKELDIAKQKARADADALYEDIEAEIAQRMKTANAQIQASEAVVQGLKEENQKLRDQMVSVVPRSSASTMTILLNSQEQDLYRYERQQIVLDVLQKEWKGMPQGTRREHVLGDIVRNNSVQSERDEIVRKIRSIFHDYQRMNAKIERTLESIGFELLPGNNHYKMRFKEDDRYVFSFSKTPSDGRAGKNNISAICRKFL